jgi:hypothetical protein
VHNLLGYVDEIAGTGLDGVRAIRPELHPQRTSKDGAVVPAMSESGAGRL